MKRKILKRSTVISGSILALGMSCSSKKTKSTTTVSGTSTSVLTPSEDTAVTTVTGQLQIASSVTILPAKSGAASLALDGKRGYQLTVDGRKLNLRVSNEAFRAIEQAGSIMCYFGQSKFWEQANLGVYKALVDQAQCDHESKGGGGGGGGGGGSGGGESEKSQEMMVMYTKSTRVDGKPLIGEFRIPEGDNTIQAKVVVVAPPSDENPAGIFSMAYTFYAADGTAGQFGFIRTKRTDSGAFVLETAGTESGEGQTGTSQGVAELTRDGATDNFIGYVRSISTSAREDESNSEQYKVRFNSDYLNVSGGALRTYKGETKNEVADGCYDRNKYKTGIYSYDLADSTGKVVTLNSGFPAEFEKDGKTYSANASYYGLWTSGIDLPNGATVNKVDFTGGQKVKTAYTLVKAAGKLVKHVKSTTSLGALKGVDLQFYDGGESFIVRWDGSKLSKVSKVNYTDKGMVEEAASGDVIVPDWGTNLYVSSLNAGVNISKSTVLSNDTVLSYHSELTVSGTASVPAGDLVCFQNCPVMAPSASAFNRSQGGSNGPSVSGLYETKSVTWGDQEYQVNQTQNIVEPLATFTFDSSTLLLKNHAGVAFALPTGLPTNDEETQNMDNVFSGPLIPKATWEALADKTIDPWRVEQELDVYYTWSAGPSSWSKFQSLKDAAGVMVSFDRPLEISYTLATADEFDGLTDTNVVGKSYRLNYGGPGQLWGIPWKYNGTVGHEMPLFSLKAGTKLGDYTVNPVEGDQRMATTEAANCASLSLDDLPELPTLENSSVDVGVFGDDNSPTRYISGVSVQ